MRYDLLEAIEELRDIAKQLKSPESIPPQGFSSYAFSIFYKAKTTNQFYAKQIICY